MPHVMTPRMTSEAKEYLGSTHNSINKMEIISYTIVTDTHAHSYVMQAHIHTCLQVMVITYVYWNVLLPMHM